MEEIEFNLGDWVWYQENEYQFIHYLDEQKEMCTIDKNGDWINVFVKDIQDLREVKPWEY